MLSLRRWTGLLGSMALCLSLAAAQAPPPAPVEAAAPPSAAAVLDLALEAIGGRTAVEKITSRVTRGSIEIPAMGIKAPMATWTAAPDKFYSLSESEAIGRLESGTDGRVYWEITAMTGPRIKEGEERAASVRETRFHNDLEWRTLYKEAVNQGKTSVAGSECWKIEMIPPEGKSEIRYYDVSDHLMRKAEQTMVSEMGEIKIEIYPEEYRAVDGVLIPHRVRQVLMGVQEMVLTLESCENNVAIPDSVFALPAEIAALATQGTAPDKPGE